MVGRDDARSPAQRVSCDGVLQNLSLRGDRAMDVTGAAVGNDGGRCRCPRRGVLPVVSTTRGPKWGSTRHRAAEGLRLAGPAECGAERAPAAQGVLAGPRRG